MNKSHIQNQVLTHLKGEGFNCIAQSAFPSIVAWRPFTDAQEKFLTLKVKAVIDGKTHYKILYPFFVAMVECKKLNKKEKVKSQKLLKEGRCNTFLVASKDKKKLKFEEVEKEKIEIENSPSLSTHSSPSYIG